MKQQQMKDTSGSHRAFLCRLQSRRLLGEQPFVFNDSAYSVGLSDRPTKQRHIKYSDLLTKHSLFKVEGGRPD